MRRVRFVPPKGEEKESKSSNVEAGEAIIFSYKISRDRLSP